MSKWASAESQWPPLLAFSALIAGSVFLLEPAKAVLINRGELASDPSTVLGQLLLPWCVGTLCLSAIGLLLATRLGARATAVFAALYVGLWMQGNLFVWTYGPFDGTPIDWTAHRAAGVLEGVAWCGLFVVALVFSDRVRRRWLGLASLVVALQAAGLAGHAWSAAPSNVQPVDLATTAGRSFAVHSREANVVVIVLDALQSDFFAEALRSPEFAASVPPGFVYHRNATSLYALTQFSLQSILTGAAVPDGVDAVAWTKTQISRSVAADLASRGFDATLATFSWFLPGCGPRTPQRCLRAENLASRAGAGAEPWLRVERSEANQMFSVGLFRLTPHALKPRVYDHGDWQLPPLLSAAGSLDVDPRIPEATRLDLEILDRLTRDVEARSVPPRFRLLHLFGPHPPARLDRDCRFAAAGPIDSRARAVETTQCILTRVFGFLEALDRAGGYDASLLFIVADHGHPFLPVDPSVADPTLPPAQALPGLLESWSRGVPIFLSKNLGDRGPLRVSDVPVSLCDIPASIYDVLNLAAPAGLASVSLSGCPSIFANAADPAAPADRPVRMHYRYSGYSEQQESGRLEEGRFTFEPYSVDGHSWHRESWRPLSVGSRAVIRESKASD